MPDQEDKPVLDEQTLAMLLEAAYVLQEHKHQREKLELDLKSQLESPNELQNDQLRAQEAAASTPPPDTPTSGQTSAPRDDYTLTLAQIVKTQRQIQVQHLNLENVMALVTERAAEIAQASGAGIGILDGNMVRYPAASGASALPVASEVPMEKALCYACLRTGQPIRCEDVNPEFLLDAEECLRRGIQAILAVPVYREGEVAGALELYFPGTRAFSEQDVNTGQLMAGLVTEAFARNSEGTWKKSLASERSAMLEALERLRPNLTAMAEDSAQEKTQGSAVVANTAVSAERVVCKCGHELMTEEQFCGKCGSPRVAGNEPLSLQSKLASLWHMQQAARESAAQVPVNGNGAHPDIPLSIDPADLAKLHAGELDAGKHDLDAIEPFIDPELELQIQRMVESLAAEETKKAEMQQAEGAELPFQMHSTELDAANLEPSDDAEVETEAIEAPETGTALAKTDDALTWTSAANARDFLEQLAATRDQSALARFWHARRGDIYLAVAVILVAVVIRWGIWSNHSVGATTGPTTGATRRRPAPDADLSIFDKFLISVGLAEAPEAPEYKGNPNAQVWVDLRTALYYCPGADLYGKTAKGKFTNQRDAQLDQFEPAYRKACD